MSSSTPKYTLVSWKGFYQGYRWPDHSAEVMLISPSSSSWVRPGRAVLSWKLFPVHFHLLFSWPLYLGLLCDNVSFVDHRITWDVRQESLATSLSLFPWIPFIISYSFKYQMPSLSWCSNCPQGICHFLQVSALIFALYKVSQGYANKTRIPTPWLYVFPWLLLLYVFPLICFCTIALICRLKVLWK